MAGQFARQDGIFDKEPSLDKRMSGLFHDRLTAQGAYCLWNDVRTLQSVNDRAFFPVQHVADQQHEGVIAADDLPSIVHEAEPVAVAVIGHAEICPLFDDFTSKEREVFRL